VITPLNTKDEQIRKAADTVYDQLSKSGVEVILDDRDERAGVKLNDADLVGFPFRITIGQKKLKNGLVELYDRATRKSEDVDLSTVAELAVGRIRGA